MNSVNKLHSVPRSLYVYVVLALLLICSLPVRADLVVTVGSASANASSTGNSFDVLLINTGPAAITIGGFTFELVSPSADINFTEANISSVSAPYIFAGNSLFGPVINTTTGQTLDASDLFDTFNAGATIGSGVTLALGHVLFDVSNGASTESISIALSGFPATSLSDENGADVAITSLNTGTITVTGTTPASVPEPGSLVLMTSGFAAFLTATRRKLRS